MYQAFAQLPYGTTLAVNCRDVNELREKIASALHTQVANLRICNLRGKPIRKLKNLRNVIVNYRLFGGGNVNGKRLFGNNGRRRKSDTDSEDEEDTNPRKTRDHSLLMDLVTMVVHRKVYNDTKTINYDVVQGWKEKEWQEINQLLREQSTSTGNVKHYENWKDLRNEFLQAIVLKHDRGARPKFQDKKISAESNSTNEEPGKLRSEKEK